jgi:hypothetical protein
MGRDSTEDDNGRGMSSVGGAIGKEEEGDAMVVVNTTGGRKERE